MTSSRGPRPASLRAACGALAIALAVGCTPRSTEPEAAPTNPAAAAPATPAPDGSPSAPTPSAPTPSTPPAGQAPAEEPPATGGCENPLGCYGDPERVGAFDAEAIPEASGLAAARRNPGLLYLLDDRRGTDALRVVRTDGHLVGSLPVAGMDARDGESLATGPCAADDPAPCLYVGDIGDNERSREEVVVHRVVEPDLSGGRPPVPLPADTARLRYPDGPHDAEALLVDDAGRVHVVTKAPFDRDAASTGEARLYRAERFADGVLTDLGRVPVPEPAFPIQSMFVGNVVTGGEHRDGRVLLRTYDQVLEYVAPEGEADLAALATWAVREVPAPFERQSEAITWAADGCGYLTVGEAAGDIWRVPCAP